MDLKTTLRQKIEMSKKLSEIPGVVIGLEAITGDVNLIVMVSVKSYEIGEWEANEIRIPFTGSRQVLNLLNQKSKVKIIIELDEQEEQK